MKTTAKTIRGASAAWNYIRQASSTWNYRGTIGGPAGTWN